MRRIALTLFGALALLLSFGASAGAQNLNCADFNGDQDAAQRELNSTWPNDPHGLDGNNNGWACEGVFDYIGSEPNAANQGGGAADPTAPVAEDTAPVADDTATIGGSTTTDVVGTSTLPATGSGPISEANTISVSLLAASALMLAGASLFVQRTAIERA